MLWNEDLSATSLNPTSTNLQNGQTHSNNLSVFDHFVGLALKGLIFGLTKAKQYSIIKFLIHEFYTYAKNLKLIL